MILIWLISWNCHVFFFFFEHVTFSQASSLTQHWDTANTIYDSAPLNPLKSHFLPPFLEHFLSVSSSVARHEITHNCSCLLDVIMAPFKPCPEIALQLSYLDNIRGKTTQLTSDSALYQRQKKTKTHLPLFIHAFIHYGMSWIITADSVSDTDFTTEFIVPVGVYHGLRYVLGNNYKV